MIKNDYEVKYPLDAISVEKFSELFGKSEIAVRKMILNNKLPVVDMGDPDKPNARVAYYHACRSPNNIDGDQLITFNQIA
ncbi:hypothetical protein CBG25_19115 [Arsenophonus sp. ENCA]|uniref:Cox family DNA-binding protein n=1 Tax=Arsenophonus sp. ENCA TaxID=1987579 RepID=UPI000BDDE5C7|nr:Cox family DNA-binding protein [Arsenophonus sp. ENCA]PAV01029.1 hypothetical protein CBG25_19115 [Arsenophonus sp. ENCA]